MATKIGDEKNYLPPITPEKKILGRYEIKRNIGQGGQGFVYLAHDPVLDVDVIIKGLRYDDTDSRKKFEKEVKTLRALHSTNIVRTYDFFTDGKSEYIGMEYVEGMDLDKLINNQKGIPIPLAMHIFRQVCQGLYDAHRKGIIHRDIKPQNVLISKDGDVLLGDFGLAGREEDFSKDPSYYGSILFMAPELLLDNSCVKANIKTDIYSMGATLYNMFFGETPFHGSNKDERKENIKKHDYKKPAERDPDIPSAVNELIVNMLEKDREKRPDIEGVIASVEEYERSLTSGIRAILDDALKISIASDKKLDYHSLKLQNGFVTDLCSPASLYTKSCSVQLSVDIGTIQGSGMSSERIPPHLYALIFKADDMGFHFQNAIELSNSLRDSEYQSGMQYFEPGEYLARVNFRSRTYLWSFSLQRGQKQKIVIIASPSTDPRVNYDGHLGLHVLDKESGEDITDRAVFKWKNLDGIWVKRHFVEGERLVRLLSFATRVSCTWVSCEGYESRKLYFPPETELSLHCFWGIPLSQKIGETGTDVGNEDFDIADGVLRKYRGSDVTVTIPDGVTEIASGAFRGCTSLLSVTIPKGVTEIGDEAFQNCNIRELSHPCLTIRVGLAIQDGKLLYCASQEANIKIPSDITEICESAFSGCTSLASVTIPNSVTAICSSAFHGCTSLASVTIPNSVTAICSSAFHDCTSLASVALPEGVAEISPSAFRGCASLSSVTIPDSVKAICSSAFHDCTSLASVALPKGVSEIGSSAFHDCKSLASVALPKGVSEIGSSAFHGCTSLSSVTIPGSVTEIGERAFEGCTSLSSVTIPDSVSEIGERAFEGCTSLSSVTIPGSVTEIGEHAFEGCTSLSSVTIPGSVTEIGERVFEGCTSLSSVTILEGVTKIDWHAFEGCTSLSSVTISDSVTEIGDDAFEGCTSLASVTIPDSVTEIGLRAFAGCTSLASVTIPDSVKIGGGAFAGCNIRELSHPCLTIWDGFAIKDGRLRYCASASQASDITLPEGVTEIGNDAFEGCTSLASITIPDSVKAIGWGAFRGCTSLASVTIPDGVTKIGRYAFEGCTSLASVTIPDSVTEIGERAFEGCNIGELSHSCLTIRDGLAIKDGTLLYCASASQASDITIPEGVTKIGFQAFRGCRSLASVTLPDSITEIGGEAFSRCTSLVSVSIPESVTRIGFYAFACCTSLASVTIPGSVTEIGKRAFEDCTSLMEIRYAGTKEQWAAVKKDENWNKGVPAKSVTCSDGEVTL